MRAEESERLIREEAERPELVDRLARALVTADRPAGTQASRTGTWVSDVRSADENNQVVTVHGGTGDYRRRPCGPCPWKTSNTGTFPAEAFKHSAGTAYDLAVHKFACHEAGTDRPRTCAGFLLRGAEHNMAVRMAHIDPDTLDDGGHVLHAGYRSMAVANGVDPDDPVLRPCRASSYELEEEDGDDHDG